MLSQQITDSRNLEFTNLKGTIIKTIRNHDVYEREESIRRVLIEQVNTLKDCKLLFCHQSLIHS